MKPITFAEIINDLPDDMIESAAEPHSNSIRWYHVSAIAACLVIGVTAVVYPKLKVQPPEIREPDVTVTETMLVTSTTETETSITMSSAVSVATTVSESAALTFTTAQRTTASTLTTANVTFTIAERTTASTQTTTAASALETHDTEPVRTTTISVTESAQSTTALMPVSTVPLTTEQTAELTSFLEITQQEGTHGTTPETTTAVTETAPIAVTEVNPNTWIVPEWIRFHNLNEAPDPQPPSFCDVSCKILSDAELKQMKEEYEILDIPLSFFVDYDFLLITMDTNYLEGRVTAAQFTENTLKLQIIYPDDIYYQHGILIFIPIPHGLTLDGKDIILQEKSLTIMQFEESKKEVCNLILK